MTIITFSDLETTGKLHPDHRIIEASFRSCNLETQEEVANTLFRFNPMRNIDAKALAVHHITLDELKKEPEFKDRIPNMNAILASTDILVYHNGGSFDWPFMEQEFTRCGTPIIRPKLIFDTMVSGNFATELGKSPTLSELCFSLDVAYDPESAHSGDYDTAVLRDCFFNGKNLGWFKV